MREVLKGKSLTERIDWAAGRLILSIGEGRFKDELSIVIQVIEANTMRIQEEQIKKRKK